MTDRLSSGRWPAKAWEAVAIRAQEGRAPAFYLALAWGRIQQDRRNAWEAAKRRNQKGQKTA